MSWPTCRVRLFVCSSSIPAIREPAFFLFGPPPKFKRVVALSVDGPPIELIRRFRISIYVFLQHPILVSPWSSSPISRNWTGFTSETSGDCLYSLNASVPPPCSDGAGGLLWSPPSEDSDVKYPEVAYLSFLSLNLQTNSLRFEHSDGQLEFDPLMLGRASRRLNPQMDTRTRIH